jgi:hypothetical protein
VENPQCFPRANLQDPPGAHAPAPR